MILLGLRLAVYDGAAILHEDLQIPCSSADDEDEGGGDRSDLAVTREELGNTAIKDVAVLYRDLGKVLIVYVRSSLSFSFPNFSCIFVRQGSPQAQRCT